MEMVAGHGSEICRAQLDTKLVRQRFWMLCMAQFKSV
jgi:hypothetical protein